LVFLSLSFCSFQLIQEELREKGIEAPESSSEAKDNEDTNDGEEDSGEDGSDGGNNGDAEDSSDHDEFPRRLTSPAEMLDNLPLRQFVYNL
jgi:hypothetical protein